MPNHDVWSATSSGRVACAVTDSGRVCGMPIGMPCTPDGQRHVETLDDLPDGGHVPLPLHVGLDAVQEQERHACRVLDQVDDQLGLGVRRPRGLVERHDRPPRPVVEQLVDVERRQARRRQLVDQVLGGQLAGVARVDEAAHGVHEDGTGAVHGPRLDLGGDLGVDVVDLARVQHGCALTSVRSGYRGQRPPADEFFPAAAVPVSDRGAGRPRRRTRRSGGRPR